MVLKDKHIKEEKTYIERLEEYRNFFIKSPSVVKIIDSALSVDKSLKNKNIPNSLPYLELGDEQRKDISIQMAKVVMDNKDENNSKKLEEISANADELNSLITNFRQHLIQEFGMWNFVNMEWLKDLSGYLKGKKVLEIMSGNGYLSAGLKALEPDQQIIPTDNFEWEEEGLNPNPIIETEKVSALDAVKKYYKEADVILMSWAPSNKSDDFKVIKFLREHDFFKNNGEVILVADTSGLTNSKTFWQQIQLKEIPELNNNFNNFDFINDKVYSAF